MPITMNGIDGLQQTEQAINRIRALDTDELNHKFGYMNRKEPIKLIEVNDAFKENPALQISLHNC